MYIKFTFLTILSIMLFGEVQSQNLVPNPSFEKHPQCPVDYEQVERAEPWKAYQGTPELFSSCTRQKTVTIPRNYFGYVQPTTGGSCAGFANFHKQVPNEYVGVKLKEPLIKGKKYKVGCQIALAQTYSGFANNNIGIVFTNHPETLAQNKVKAHIKVDKVISSNDGWYKIEEEFEADDDYQYLVIGVFYTKEETKFVKRSQGINNSSYYFLDDVFVTPKSDCPESSNYRAKVVDDEKGKGLDAIIRYTNTSTNITEEIQAHEGEYNLTLEDCYTYNIEIQAEGHYPIIELNVKKPKSLTKPKKMIFLRKGKTIILNNIFFDYNKATLKKASHFELDILADLLVKKTIKAILISGHTDRDGSDDSNLKLSQARAATVQKYLLSKGVKAEQLQSKGFGESQPIAPNDTPEGRAKNRRVEFKIM